MLTLRILAGLTYHPVNPLTSPVEFIDVSQFADDFNDTRNGTLTYPVVADPRNTDHNEPHLTDSGVATINAGRQVIRLNRTHFIGAQDFRQTMQVCVGAVIDAPLPVVSRLGYPSVYGFFSIEEQRFVQSTAMKMLGWWR